MSLACVDSKVWYCTAHREWLKTPPQSDAELYRKDVAGFLIFLVVVFTVVMISLHA
jgi:hypothetical protein